MLGTIVNTCTIIIGSTFGHLAKRGIKEKYQTVMFQAMGLASLALGFNAVANHMPKSAYPVLFVVSLAIGGLFGTWLDLDGRFSRFVGSRSKEGDKGNLAQIGRAHV